MNKMGYNLKQLPVILSVIFLGLVVNSYAQDIYLQGAYRVYNKWFDPWATNSPLHRSFYSGKTISPYTYQEVPVGDLLFSEMSDSLVSNLPFAKDEKSFYPPTREVYNLSMATKWPYSNSFVDLSQHRVWLEASAPVNFPRTCILRIKRSIDNINLNLGRLYNINTSDFAETSSEYITRVIPAYSLRSFHYDLLDQFDLAEHSLYMQFKTTFTRISLLPVEINTVNRDVMSFQWAQKKPWDSSTKVVYAGPHSGDMIEWRFPELSSGSSEIITWKAKHVGSGEVIPGPSGPGVNFWRIANEGANDANGDQWLRWKPGTYKITCNIAGTDLEIQTLRVGYRSDHMLVIGQIVPTHTHDLDKPVGAASVAWAKAVAEDFVATVMPPFATAPMRIAVVDQLKTVFSTRQERGAEAWAASWAGGLEFPPGLIPSWFPPGLIPAPIAPILVPPASRGPAAASFISGGTMTPNQHYWATQHMLNTNPDTPNVPSEIYMRRVDASSDEEAIAYIFAAQQYRISHEFQARFLLNENGKIDVPTRVILHNRAANGPTKLKIGEFSAGDLGYVITPVAPFLVIPLPPCNIKSFPNESSETNRHNGAITISASGDEISSFATARIGEKGRQVSFRQFGKDAPWIFSEIIFKVGSD